MAHLNSCSFIGRIGKEPETRHTGSGKQVTTFSLAVSEKRKGNEKTTWLRCIAWEKTSEIIQKYCGKGSQLYIDATFQINEWEKDGQKQYSPEFVIRNMQMLDSKQRQSNEPMHNVPPSNNQLEDDIPY